MSRAVLSVETKPAKAKTIRDSNLAEDQRRLPSMRRAFVSAETFNSAAWIAGEPRISDDIPAVIQSELNREMDRDTMERMRYLARKKRMLRPDITDDEMADYLALAENFQNFEDWISARRSTTQASVYPVNGFLAVIAVIFGLLTAMLIAAIAISV
jgi:hypothetical protein